MAPDFARLAERTGVPTYVLVLPGPAGTRVPYDEPEGSPRPPPAPRASRAP
ncbi:MULTISPECIES: hypothetical protein [Streptomyces]|uniref:hypothetical protein n=1 Tax=Streptomyces TaxID=1883 RepID=UPI0035A98903